MISILNLTFTISYDNNKKAQVWKSANFDAGLYDIAT